MPVAALVPLFPSIVHIPALWRDYNCRYSVIYCRAYSTKSDTRQGRGGRAGGREAGEKLVWIQQPISAGCDLARYVVRVPASTAECAATKDEG